MIITFVIGCLGYYEKIGVVPQIEDDVKHDEKSKVSISVWSEEVTSQHADMMSDGGADYDEEKGNGKTVHFANKGADYLDDIDQLESHAARDDMDQLDRETITSHSNEATDMTILTTVDSSEAGQSTASKA